MHAFAFGELGLMPDDYFDMLPAHYYAKVEGYNNKRKHDAELMRQQAFILIGHKLKQGTTYESFKRNWVLWYDEQQERETFVMTEEQIKAVLERHEKYHPKK